MCISVFIYIHAEISACKLPIFKVYCSTARTYTFICVFFSRKHRHTNWKVKENTCKKPTSFWEQC